MKSNDDNNDDVMNNNNNNNSINKKIMYWRGELIRPLCYCILIGASYNHKILNYLLNQPRIDLSMIDGVSSAQETLLMIACYYCKKNINTQSTFELLLNHSNMTQTIINMQNARMQTALHCAIQRGSPDSRECASLLINDERTNVNICDKKGQTPLVFLLGHCNWRMTEEHKILVNSLLKRKDIDVNIKSTKGKSALQLAKECDKVDENIVSNIKRKMKLK